MQGIYIRCIARYKLIYTQATARWKFGDTYSETCCYVARSKIFSWAGKIIWVIGEGRLSETATVYDQLYSAGISMIVRGASSMNTLHGLRTVLGFNWNSLKLPDISRKGVIVLWSISSNNTVKHQNELSSVLDILYSF